MNNKTKSWDVLKISGSRENQEILTSYLEDHSLGIIENNLQTIMYFDQKNKNSAINIIDSLKDKIDIYTKWEIEKYQNWNTKWKKYFTPINIDNQINILPNWEKDKHKSNSCIYIRPGMSFGTGHHETTYLMIESLLKYKDKNYTLLDLGSGSGILSIVASKLHYTNVTAIENDDECKDDFYYNIKINNCLKIDMNWENVFNWKNFNFDIVAANIDKKVIKKVIKNIEFSPAIFIFSGLLVEDEDEIVEYLNNCNYKIDKIKKKKEWISIICYKHD